MVSERSCERAFFGLSALLFAASAAVMNVWCASMSAMGEIAMPGGWLEWRCASMGEAARASYDIPISMPVAKTSRPPTTT
jgi:hypothetical protein